MITLTGEYALRAMVFMAFQPPGQFALALEAGKELSIPPDYLGKVLQALARNGLLESQRGPHGGFRLHRPAASICLFEILSVVEPVRRYKLCLMGRKACSDETPCPIHHTCTWRVARNSVLTLLQTTPLTRLMENQALLKGAPAPREEVPHDPDTAGPGAGDASLANRISLNS